MDATHTHLILNHIPILGTLFGLCLLLVGIVKNKSQITNAGLTTFVIVAILTVPVFLTGEGSEESVEQVSGVSEHFIELHEDLAKVALWLAISLGILSVITLALSTIKSRNNHRLKLAILVLSFISFGVMTVVGNYGGKIRHSEIRS
ncbi:MAG: hypothetical protein ABJG47_17205 [Ekhidna sp.]